MQKKNINTSLVFIINLILIRFWTKYTIKYHKIEIYIFILNLKELTAHDYISKPILKVLFYRLY